jgi:DNA mismatch endonuclease (patch repair protein)
VIFVDGDFWHGRNWEVRRAKLAVGSNAEYWVSKIERTRQRDRWVTAHLRRLGWRVIRVWESDIRRDEGEVARRLLDRIERD